MAHAKDYYSNSREHCVQGSGIVLVVEEASLKVSMMRSLRALTDTLRIPAFSCALLRSVLCSCSAQLSRQRLSNRTHSTRAPPPVVAGRSRVAAVQQTYNSWGVAMHRLLWASSSRSYLLTCPASRSPAPGCCRPSARKTTPAAVHSCTRVLVSERGQ